MKGTKGRATNLCPNSYVSVSLSECVVSQRGEQGPIETVADCHHCKRELTVRIRTGWTIGVLPRHNKPMAGAA